MSVIKPKKTMGAPTTYTDELADKVCELVATNPVGLPTLCAVHDWMPAESVIYQWRLRHENFAKKYAQAKIKQVEILAEEIIDIADFTAKDTIIDDDGNEHINSEWVARSRLRIDTRKWLASKLAPKIYGDRRTEEQSNPRETLDKIQALVADLNKTNVSDI